MVHLCLSDTEQEGKGWVNVALRRFLHIQAISRQKEAEEEEEEEGNAPLLFRMTSRFLYSAQYHRQQFTLHAFQQFGALYLHNHVDKSPARPGFEPSQVTSPSEYEWTIWAGRVGKGAPANLQF